MKSIFFEHSLFVEEKQSKSKFIDDVISFDDSRFMIKSWGYFLNINECLEKYSTTNIVELIQKLFLQDIPIPTILYGGYVIIVYDKRENVLHVYNDLLSKRSLFYYDDERSRKILFSDSFLDIVGSIKEKKMPYTIDQLGVKMMLWHRMFYDDVTYLREVKFLRPFDYLIVRDNKLEVKRINRQDILDVSLEDAAKEIHQRFEKAVRLQYQKNEKKGYPQVITLSGGMDSRSTFLYGLSAGYNKQYCYCYAESTSADYDFSKNLANKNHCMFFYHSIDNGNHLQLRNEICEANEGQMAYSGPSGTYNSLLFYDTNRWGIVHTGLGGGEIMGDMRVGDNSSKWENVINALKYKMGRGKKDNSWESFSQSLKCTDDDLIRIEKFKLNYHDFNEFQSLNDLRRCLNSQKLAQFFGVEYVSPFLYEDFFNYMLRIPYNLTKGRKLYRYWQKKYNPKQFETPSTFMMGCRPSNKIGYYAKRFGQYVLNRFGKKTRYDMTPYDYWLAHNPTIIQEMEKLFGRDVKNIKGCDEIYQLLIDVWNKKAAPRPNVLTASWMLGKILEQSDEDSCYCEL